MVLLISRREVEAGDLASVLSRLKVFLATREDAWLNTRGTAGKGLSLLALVGDNYPGAQDNCRPPNTVNLAVEFSIQEVLKGVTKVVAGQRGEIESRARH